MQKTCLNWRQFATATSAVALMAIVLLVGSGRPATARAAGCGVGPCMRVDALPGGGVDDAAAVADSFTVDVVLTGTAGDVAGFNFELIYDATALAAQAPTNAGLPSAAFECGSPAPQGAHARPDGSISATFGCFSTDGTTIGDGPIARVQFTSLRAAASQLELSDVAAANWDAVTVLSCDPGEPAAGGGCANASVSTTGAGGPPPPPPPLPPPGADACDVSYALDGETVQCADGSRVRFIGVASPLGADPGAGWARALTQWFLAGKRITLEQDVSLYDEFGSRYAYPHVIGTDGNDYNISVLIIYIGMAHHLFDGTNGKYNDWLAASQVWGRTACWNMWSAGNPFSGESGCR